MWESLLNEFGTKTTTHHSNAGIEIACRRFEKPHHEAEELFSDLGQIREQHIGTKHGHSRDHSKFIECSKIK